MGYRIMNENQKIIDKNNVTVADLQTMSDSDINKLLKSCTASDLVDVCNRLLGKDSNIGKMINSWIKSGTYSENQLRKMIIHACENRIKSIKSDYDQEQYEARKNKNFISKVKAKMTKKLGDKKMLDKNEINELSSVIREQADDRLIDFESAEILIDLVESCEDNEYITESVLDVVNEYLVFESEDEEETEEEKEDIEELSDKKKSLKTVADIDKNESRIRKIKEKLDNKK